MTESNPLAAEKARRDAAERQARRSLRAISSTPCAAAKPPTLNGKILDGHISSALCHTGNISYRLGKKTSPDEMREEFKGNKEAIDSLERLAAHLAANEVDINVDKLTLGEFLKMDPKTEKLHRQRRGRQDAHPRVPRAVTWCRRRCNQAGRSTRPSVAVLRLLIFLLSSSSLNPHFTSSSEARSGQS